MNKELICKRFSKNIKTYTENARIQKQMADKLLGLLNRKDFENVLEIGCGSGLLTDLLNKEIHFSIYEANDIVKECESYISKINQNINFINSDIEKYIQNSSKKYDLIISNASLQWIENFENFINTLISKLNNNGILLFSTFGKENFREIYHIIGKSLNYFSIHELQLMFNEFNPSIEEELRIMAFKSPKDVLKHLQATGVNALSEEVWTKKDMLNFEKGYNNFCSNHPTLTYHPIYVKIIKNNSLIG